MKLRDLDATFVGNVRPGGFQMLEGVDGAQGVMFQCPKCAQGKPTCEGSRPGLRAVEGAHSVICWFTNPKNAPRVPDELDPKPGRWETSGTSLDDLTFVGPAAASVALYGDCNAHFFVRNGEIVNA